MRLQQTASKYKYYALAFSIPAVLMLIIMIIRGCEPFGDSSYLYSDSFHQYFPFFLEFRRALLSGESIEFTWSVGMGMDYLSLIAYYLASPLNLLSILIPESWALEYFSLLMPLRLGLASLFFAIFLNRIFHKNDISIALFGSFYGLCAWAMGYQWNVMWMDTFALFPLMVLGTVYLLRDRKYVLYTVVLFLSVFSNYYIGLFSCIFVLFFFFGYEICRWRGIKRFFSDLFRIAVFTVIAIGMTALLELPALAGLQNTQSSVNKFPTEFRLNIVSEHTIAGLFQAMALVSSNMAGGLLPSFKEGLPNMYCGVGTMILAILFLGGKNIKVRDKLASVFMLVFLIVSCIIRQLDYIWHGMHFTNMIPYRFMFLYSFVLLYMAYRAYLQRDQFRWWQIASAGVMSTLILLMSDSRTTLTFILYNGVFLLLYLGIFIYSSLRGKKPEEKAAAKRIADYETAKETIVETEAAELTSEAQEEKQIAAAQYEADKAVIASCEERNIKKQRRCALALTAVFGLELIGTILNFGVRFPTTYVGNYPNGTSDTKAVIDYMKTVEADNLFYRAEPARTQILNEGALLDLNGAGAFTSSANVKVTEFMKALGFGAKNTYNRYAYEQSSPVADLFLNLKYMIERSADQAQNDYFLSVYSSGNVSLLENQYYLPLGFLANQDLANVDWNETDPYAFQNKLFRAATGVEEDVWHMADQSTITANDVELTQNTGKYCKYTGAKNGSSITYEFTADRNGLMCLHLDVTDRNSYTVSKNGEDLYSETLSLPQLISACTVSAGDTVQVKLTTKDDEEGSMTVKAGILDAGMFYEGYEVLAASQLELTEFSTTEVAGTIDCNRNGLLYTSIPQNGSNWKVSVDGQLVEPTLIGEAMIGVYLTEGEHEVHFEYENKAFSYGWKISLACALSFAIILCVYRPNKKVGKYQK